MKSSGVYTITVPDGRRYVGSAARGFGARWRIHRHHLRRGTHHNPALQAIANKHGVDAMTFRPLIVCSPDSAVFYEQIAMDALCPELNATPMAGSTFGYRHSEETKAKFHLRRKAEVTEKGKEARRIGVKSWRMSDEHKAAIQAARGRPVRCVEKDMRFPSANAAAIWLRTTGVAPKAKSTNVALAADGRLISAYRLHWERL